MEQLDLTRHNPDQFEGKSLSVGGRDYVIGALFRDSTQGHSHVLINRASGLALHVVQIRREYRDEPASASGASRVKVEMTAKLRTSMLEEKGETPIRMLRAIDAASGSLELHEFPWHPAAPGDDAMRRAGEHMEANRLDSAKAELAALLATNPHHTNALGALAECHARAGNPLTARCSRRR